MVTMNYASSPAVSWVGHQREHSVSDGVVSRDLEFKGLPMRILSRKCSTAKQEWMGYILYTCQMSWFIAVSFLLVVLSAVIYTGNMSLSVVTAVWQLYY
jgi:hypothetical protein